MKLLSNQNSKNFNFLVPTAWLSIADQVIILVMIPLLNSFVYPKINKHLTRAFDENLRIVLGMSFSALAVIMAGILESERLAIFLNKQSIIQIIDNTTYIAADLHIVWQIPQYTSIGLGEVFCGVTSLYLAYSAAPKSMQSIIMGLFYLFSGLGSFLGTLIISLQKSFVYSSESRNYDDINCSSCHLNYYFYILAGMQILGILIYLYIDQKCNLIQSMKNVIKQKLNSSSSNQIDERTYLSIGSSKNYKSIDDQIYTNAGLPSSSLRNSIKT